MTHEQADVAELIDALELLHERAQRLFDATRGAGEDDLEIPGALARIRLAIAELRRHGIVALPIMQTAHHRFEMRIATLEDARVH